ncbi:DeoR/GlpR family DNA-binding transcription regulator [uncultured Maritimibacter sp.]|uniref:DeoR/GlpR family DNA-binding transcription regulator n=1 Tax=uncultured Maritimibacter sp. TaxID=991866 RepID=UPI002618F594|nr:DeoR/GlpR family DNA-binding transcription regulator [uncultured Maritimibacter sp.]
MSRHLPDARRAQLEHRLTRGEALDLASVARDLDVSVDTVRRDLKELEKQGLARYVRGGALPVARPPAAFVSRVAETGPINAALAEAALPLVTEGMVLGLDGGTAVLALAERLAPLPDLLVVTPSPAAAMACLARGIEVHMVGGTLAALGAICVGHEAVTALSDISIDLAFLGVCGLDTGFGLSADDPREAHVKRALIASAHRSVMLTDETKLGRRARHRVAPCGELHSLVTTAPAHVTQPFTDHGIEVIHA